MEKYDFSGWATRNNLKCSDGRIIMKDAFKHCDGLVVPLCWGHNHNDPQRVLGHAYLENRDEGVYTYGVFNDTEQGLNARQLVQHGDVVALSIYANQLKQQGPNVQHGMIREVSLVLAGANPGAYIEDVIRHSADGEPIIADDEGVIHTGTLISLYHADESNEKEDNEDMAEERTLEEIYNDMSEEQKDVVHAVAGMVLDDDDDDENEYEEYEDGDEDDDDSEGGDEGMKHNLFDNEEYVEGGVLSHADEVNIINLAKSSGVGSLKDAIEIYASENQELAHAGTGTFSDDVLTALLPDYKNLNPGAPDIIRQDQSWVMSVINKIHKSPYSRIRTRQADARVAELRAKGYQKKGDEKTLSGSIKLLTRTTDPQTVYRKDQLNRDDIIDITDFSVVDYQWGIMKDNMYEELALAALVGDGREDGDPDKIHETHIRSIWNDEELYTMHHDVDIEAMRQELQGTDTNAHFGENYIYAEAIITKALYAREKFKGSGRPDLYCTPHLVNVMLLARDLNGRRIYDSKADLAKALNVGEIHEIEQLEDRERSTKEGDKKKLLGLFVNLSDYQFGCAKGGELTKFEDFDIDFNQYKYLIETRLSGALVKPFSAIALEEPVTAG